MSFFGVTVEELESVVPHVNADRLEVATLKGSTFQFVVPKATYKAGDQVLYFPLDAVLPAPVTDKLGLTGKLAGTKKDRIKTIKLRGEISQGIVAPLDLLPLEFHGAKPEVITEHFGVTKYDPPPNFTTDGILLPLPPSLSMYDIESADRYQNILAELLKLESVVVTEKLEGTNFSCLKTQEGEIFVNQRSNTIQELEGVENLYWQAARDQGIIDYLKSQFTGEIAAYGELIGPGVQGNYYKLKQRQVRIFDLKLNGRWVDYKTMRTLLEGAPFECVPPLYMGGQLSTWLGDQTIKLASNGKSLLCPDRWREGVVIRPFDQEIYHQGFGRLVLKQHSPEYLASSEAI